MKAPKPISKRNPHLLFKRNPHLLFRRILVLQHLQNAIKKRERFA